jgi:aspartyl-tRNA(Asn)/glutamyl-tRNA(Gln) amidotransferase subunit A
MKANATATEIAAAVRSGETTARAVVDAALERIQRHDPRLGAFTDVLADRARHRADDLDAAPDRARLPLAGVPFAVKNLFDLEGVVTRAGSKINRDNPAAAADATLVARMEAAGAICVGALNMGEYAYDFTGENIHDGPSRNPHDLGRMSGGSSGGSGSAAAAGLVPIALGSDTNGSIRVPASLCGLFGLKPTYGRLSRHGTFPFVSSFDHLGPLARSAADLALSYDAMQGTEPNDPMQASRPVEPALPGLEQGIGGLRIAVADGYFTGEGAARAAVAHVANALGSTASVTIANAESARAAGFLITMSEGAALHLERLRTRAEDFDPDTRDRLLAGNLLPAAWIVRAQKLRRAYREKVLSLFEGVDVILAPSTPIQAPRLGQKTALINGLELPVRANLGMLCQPISFIGLPVAAVPVWLAGETLPIGVQVIAAPWREDLCLRVAHHLETIGACRAPVATEFAE